MKQMRNVVFDVDAQHLPKIQKLKLTKPSIWLFRGANTSASSVGSVSIKQEK